MPGIVCYPTPSAWHIALEQQVMIGVLVTAHLLQHFAASVMFHELSASTHTVLCARWVCTELASAQRMRQLQV
jgi:hypothetical protein